MWALTGLRHCCLRGAPEAGGLRWRVFMEPQSGTDGKYALRTGKSNSYRQYFQD